LSHSAGHPDYRKGFEDPSRFRSVTRSDILMTGAIVAWLAVTLIALGVHVLSSADDDRAELRLCAVVANAKERLACFDRFAEKSTTPPARGALAPPQAFGETSRDDD
jgi:hypothetical protein